MNYAMPPLIIGSTHLWTYHHLLSLKKLGIENKELGLIVFDEHDDIGSCQSGAPNLACWLGHAIKDGLVLEENVFVVGLLDCSKKFLHDRCPKIRAYSYDEINQGVKPNFNFENKFVWISVDADSIRNFHSDKQAVFLHKFVPIFIDAIESGRFVGADFVEWRMENCINDPPVGIEAFLAVVNILIAKHTAEVEADDRAFREKVMKEKAENLE